MACERCVCKAKYFVRLAHTFLSVGVPVSLLFKNTLLTRSLLLGENLVFGVMYVLLLVFSLSMYFMACCTDPGFLHVKMKKPEKVHEVSENNNADVDVSDGENEGSTMLKFNTEDGDFKYRLCDYCEIQQPMRTKHCEDCGKCVRKYDHHCPWLEACIGERNHKFFWLFLLSTAALIPWTFYISWNGIVYNPLWGTWLRSNILLLIDILILVIGGFVVIGLLGFHTFLMLRGLTTWEAASRNGRIRPRTRPPRPRRSADQHGFVPGRHSYHLACHRSLLVLRAEQEQNPSGHEAPLVSLQTRPGCGRGVPLSSSPSFRLPYTFSLHYTVTSA